jgi:succinate dehydrogenase (ubiquinone) iron-sulfur subunit
LQYGVNDDADAQDSYGADRKEKMQNSMSLYRCHTIFNVSIISSPRIIRRVLMVQCSKTCPKGLNPAAAIAKMKLEMATNADAA